MAFTVSPTSIRVTAGDAMFFQYQPSDNSGVPEFMDGRAFSFAIYAGVSEVALYEADLLSDGTGPLFMWKLDGLVSESLRGRTDLRFDFAERLKNGRDTIMTGTLTIDPSAPRILTHSTVVSRFAAKIKRNNDPATIDQPRFVVSYTAWTGDATPAPAWTVNPAITGTAQVGNVLTGTDGSVTNGSVTARQWKRDGVAISGATAATYTLVSADLGKVITFTVTAVGAGGTSSTTSTGTAAVVAAPVPAPVNSTAPVASGTASVGSTLSTTNGAWTNSPSSYAYQWLRGGSAISGATSATYTVVSGDQGTSLTVRVTASNAGGSATSTSNAIAIPAALPAPVNDVLPAISGTASVGSVLTTTLGSWSNGPFTYAIAWYRDNVAISGATGTTYTVTSSDEGKSITSKVTATNSTASTTATSNAIAIPAAATSPVNSTLPVLAGFGPSNVGATLTCGTGAWTNSPQSYAYQWLRSGSAISGATTNSYTTTIADSGADISCRVIASNAGGASLPAVSNARTIGVPTVTILSVSKNETDSGTNVYTHTVSRSITSGAQSVVWSFAAGSTNAADFVGGVLPTGGTITIADGASSAAITINVAGDLTVEPTESFTVSITVPAFYAAGASTSATGEIVNDDVASLPAFTSAKMNGDSRTANAGGRTISGATLGVTYGQGGFASVGFVQPLCGNKWLHGEGFNHAVGATTTLAMLERNKTNSIASTGNPANAVTNNASDVQFSIFSDGVATVHTQPGKHIFQLSSVNDNGGTAGPAYYNAPFTASKSIRDTALDLDAAGAAGKYVFLSNECPRGRQTIFTEAKTVSGNTFTASVTALHVDGSDYGAPGVIGQFSDGIRVLTKVASAPAQDQYTATNGVYTVGGTAPTTAWISYTAAGSQGSPTTDHNRTMNAWYNSKDANFIYGGNDYGMPGAQYNRPWVYIVDSFNELLDTTSGTLQYSKPGTMDIQQLHHNALGAYYYARAVKKKVDEVYPNAPSLDERPKFNNWWAATCGGTANPTLSGTLPPSMRIVTPTNIRLAGVVVGTVNTSTGAITGATITSGSYNFASGAWTITFSGTPANAARVYFEQDLGNGSSIGPNLTMNGMMDMTPATGTGLSVFTGTSSVTGVTASQVPYGYGLASGSNLLNTAIANGTASITVSSDTNGTGYPRFKLAMSGVHTAAMTITLQAQAVYLPTVRITAGDKVTCGAETTLAPGPNGYLYGTNGNSVTGGMGSTTAVTRQSSTGTGSITQFSFRTVDGVATLPVDSSIIAAHGGPLAMYRITPQVDTSQATLNGGSVTMGIATVANIPFSITSGVAQVQLRVRNDV